MSFVLKNPSGEYLKGKNAWDIQLTEDLNKARIYPTTGAAKNSMNQRGRYNRSTGPSFDVVEVEIKEVI